MDSEDDFNSSQMSEDEFMMDAESDVEDGTSPTPIPYAARGMGNVYRTTY